MKFLAIPKIHPFIKSLLLFTSLILPCISNAQTSKPWDGYWKGDLSVGGMQLTLIFHVNPPSQVGDAIIYRSTLDVPIQRLKNFKIDETEIKGEEITWGCRCRLLSKEKEMRRAYWLEIGPKAANRFH